MMKKVFISLALLSCTQQIASFSLWGQPDAQHKEEQEIFFKKILPELVYMVFTKQVEPVFDAEKCNILIKCLADDALTKNWCLQHIASNRDKALFNSYFSEAREVFGVRFFLLSAGIIGEEVNRIIKSKYAMFPTKSAVIRPFLIGDSDKAKTIVFYEVLRFILAGTKKGGVSEERNNVARDLLKLVEQELFPEEQSK